MITYDWNVVALDCYPDVAGEVDVVFTVHYTVSGTDGTYTGSSYGTVGITNDPSAPFTPYADLTKDQVVGWVQAAMGVDAVTALQENIDKQIAEQASPTVVTPPLPWGVSI